MIVRIDDHDPQIHFTPREAWVSGGSTTEYKETSRGTSTAGALMTLNFTGTGIEVYGSAALWPLTSPAVLNFFTVDGGTPVQWTQDPRTYAGPPNDVKMFSALDLKDGAHTLVMQVRAQDSGTWIDYLEVTTSESSQITTSSPELTGTPPLSGKPSSSTSERLRDTDGVLSPGTAAGIAVGATSGLFLMLILIAWGLRRRWRRSKKRSGESEVGQSSQITEGVLVNEIAIAIGRPYSTLSVIREQHYEDTKEAAAILGQRITARQRFCP
ncbi:hypothetical protein PM082_023199 [Marasmius tenuissimus]|nr:hypothetical protein PM082_023199 [Marasmius tenuissimus]